MIRSSSVAGLFYDSNPNDLRESIENCFFHELGPGKLPEIPSKGNKSKRNNKTSSIYGIMAPHAGYSYSGPIASFSYFELIENGMTNGFPDTFIILCPNHTGIGTPLSIMTDGIWETPLGNVEVDTELAMELVKSSDILAIDDSAHKNEHSIEVHLPFIQYFAEKAGVEFKIVPIAMWAQDLETSNDLSNSIIKAVNPANLTNSSANNKNPKSINIIASTDFSHYVPIEVAYKNDNMVLNHIANLNETAMINDIQKNNITMCGYGPVATTIIATHELGANTCEILKYGTSGDISGDNSSVVGYASGVFK